MGTMAALAAARGARPDARVVVCSEHAHSSVEKACRILGLEARATPVDDAFRLRADALDLTDACAVVATIGTTSTSSIDPVPAIADECGRAGVWLHVDAAYAGSAAVCPELRDAFAGWERADSVRRQPAQVAADADGLLRALDAPARRPPRRFQPRSGVPARPRGGREPLRVQPRARPPVPGAEALGGAPLLRARGPAGADPRGDRPGGAVRGLGSRRAGLGGDGAAAVLARLLPPRRHRRGERGAARARQRDRRDLHLAHEAERPLHAPARRRQRAHDRGGRATARGLGASAQARHASASCAPYPARRPASYGAREAG